jgi:hypothetical protein
MNTCYASEYCQPIKQSWGNPFNDDKIVLVFVGSGFDDHDQWRNQVETTYSDFSSYPFFDRTNWNFNAFYVDMLSDSFCETRCNGSETRVCCDHKTSIKLAKKCFPEGANLQTIVIHNDTTYGGAGYKNLNLATTTIHADSGKVAVHELGHSLFELGDEYSVGKFNQDSANCDVKGCSKWADLSEYLGVDLCSVKGCENNNYFIGDVSFMGVLDAPTGHVNLRFTCCTYLALTGSAPSYCSFYNFGDGLLNYCKSNDYQGYGQSSYPEDLQFLIGSSTTNDLTTVSSGYIFVGRPSKIHINITKQTFEYTDYIDMSGSSAGYFKLEQVLGDYHDLVSAARDGKQQVMSITIQFESGSSQVMYFNEVTSLSRRTTVSIVNTFLRHVSRQTSGSNTIDIIVDAGKGRVSEVLIDTVTVPSLTNQGILIVVIIAGVSVLIVVAYLIYRKVTYVASVDDVNNNIYIMRIPKSVRDEEEV